MLIFLIVKQANDIKFKYYIKMIIDNFLMIQVLISILLIIVTLLVYKYILRPYKDYLFYKKLLTQNYKTQVNPFSILGMSNIKQKRQEMAKYNDSHHYAKTKLIDYQVRLMKVGPNLLIDLIDPQLIKQFYEKTKERYYVKNFNTPQLSTSRKVVGEGLLLSENDNWKKKKKILSNIFNFQFIHSKIQTIAQLVQKHTNQMQNLPQNVGKDIVQVQLSGYLQKIFGNVVIKSFLGDVELNQINGKQIFQFLMSMIQLNVQRSLTPFAYLLGPSVLNLGLRAIDREVNKRNQQCKDFFRKVIEKCINEYKQQKQNKQVVKSRAKGLIWWIINNQLINHDSNNLSNQKYSIEQLISQITTFFLAGTQTTATTVTMLIYKLSQKPQILQKIKAQIAEVVGDTQLTEITLQKIKKLSYIQNVMKQILRMNGPVPSLFTREVVKDHYLGKIPMKKGMQLSCKLITNHYKPEFYQNPLQFNPDRWDTIDQSKTQKFSFFPFSHGHRVCIGQHLALLQAKIALVGLLRRYKQVRLQRPIFKTYEIITYSPERMKVYLTKN